MYCRYTTGQRLDRLLDRLLLGRDDLANAFDDDRNVLGDHGRCFLEIGWDDWIRTNTKRVRAVCSTIKLHPNMPAMERRAAYRDRGSYRSVRWRGGPSFVSSPNSPGAYPGGSRIRPTTYLGRGRDDVNDFQT